MARSLLDVRAHGLLVLIGSSRKHCRRALLSCTRLYTMRCIVCSLRRAFFYDVDWYALSYLTHMALLIHRYSLIGLSRSHMGPYFCFVCPLQGHQVLDAKRSLWIQAPYRPYQGPSLLLYPVRFQGRIRERALTELAQGDTVLSLQCLVQQIRRLIRSE